MTLFETLVIIWLALLTTAMTVFIYLGWKHDQNLDKWGIHLGKGIKAIGNNLIDVDDGK